MNPDIPAWITRATPDDLRLLAYVLTSDTADSPGIDPDDAARELAWMRGEA